VRFPIPEEQQHRFYAQVAQYLPTSFADELSRRHTSVTYAGGSTLILQGSPADVILWIISGVVKIYCLVRDGNRVLVKLAGPGDVLGYPALVVPEGGVLQPFEAQALTKCTVAMFSRDTIITMIEKLDQPTLIRLTNHFNQSSSLIAHRLVTFLGSSFRQRLELTFQDLASRFGVEDERGFLLTLKLSHMDLAEMIGSSRPMATVLIGEMVADRSLYRLGYHQYVVPRAAMGIGRANGNRAMLRSAAALGSRVSQSRIRGANMAKVRQLKPQNIESEPA
jgi:CRP-like cAMP-binding protein